MSFLFRLTLLFALICILIPTGNTQLNDEPRIDSTQAITLARAAMSDARGFCERQPDGCTAGSKIATALLYKIEAGARALYELVGEFVTTRLSQKSANADSATSKVTTSHNVNTPPLDREHGTLVPTDLKPSWHGSVPLSHSGELSGGRQTN